MKEIFFLIMLMFGFASNFECQAYDKMKIIGGFNADVIANGTGLAVGSTSVGFDGSNNNLVSIDFKAASGSLSRSFGLPANGIINSVVASTFGLSYQLASYSMSNSLRMTANGIPSTITFATPKASKTLYMLASNSGGSSTLVINVIFTDGTSQSFSGVILPDWYNGVNFAVEGVGRINRLTNASEQASPNPKLYQIPLSIAPNNQSKPIQTVSINRMTGAGSISNIFAFSIETSTLGLNEVKLEDGKVSIYPNPVKNRELFIKGESFKKVLKAEIYDMKGSLMKSITDPLRNSNKINLENLNPGNYILKLDNFSSEIIIE
ncbi:T9SS type A sorting domain-containing protein [Chryseobacterium sp. OV279]|uniref:T9SS type A sorting domain-containing protein n=1 Tax=Chryseobacterium sp. OV279 TaxID=1500285 RepID=UPI000932D271|nr:T9SS type A sorting domain-containing protein [Chryseobacterium sp. OV279]